MQGINRCESSALEETVFYIYRSDNNAVLARSIDGFDKAKELANQLRKKLGLKWDEIKFRKQQNFGVRGNSFTNSLGRTHNIDYANTVNPSKGRRFRGYTDPEGNYHDIDWYGL